MKKLIETLEDYYAQLLLVQYQTPKARETVKLFTRILLPINEATGNLLIKDVSNAFDINTATGKQLDLLGKYIGLKRFSVEIELSGEDGQYFTTYGYGDTLPSETALGFSSYDDFKDGALITYSDIFQSTNNLSDSDFRNLLKLKLVLNTSNGSRSEANKSLYRFFGSGITVEDGGAIMSLLYICIAKYSQTLKYALDNDLLPKPAGVRLSASIPTPVPEPDPDPEPVPTEISVAAQTLDNSNPSKTFEVSGLIIGIKYNLSAGVSYTPTDNEVIKAQVDSYPEYTFVNSGGTEESIVIFEASTESVQITYSATNCTTLPTINISEGVLEPTEEAVTPEPVPAPTDLLVCAKTLDDSNPSKTFQVDGLFIDQKYTLLTGASYATGNNQVVKAQVETYPEYTFVDSDGTEEEVVTFQAQAKSVAITYSATSDAALSEVNITDGVLTPTDAEVTPYPPPPVIPTDIIVSAQTLDNANSSKTFTVTELIIGEKYTLATGVSYTPTDLEFVKARVDSYPEYTFVNSNGTVEDVVTFQAQAESVSITYSATNCTTLPTINIAEGVLEPTEASITPTPTPSPTDVVVCARTLDSSHSSKTFNISGLFAGQKYTLSTGVIYSSSNDVIVKALVEATPEYTFVNSDGTQEDVVTFEAQGEVVSITYSATSDASLPAITITNGVLETTNAEITPFPPPPPPQSVFFNFTDYNQESYDFILGIADYDDFDTIDGSTLQYSNLQEVD